MSDLWIVKIQIFGEWIYPENLVVVGIITSKPVVLSGMSEELNDNYTTASESSKIKRLFRFFTNDSFDDILLAVTGFKSGDLYVIYFINSNIL